MNKSLYCNIENTNPDVVAPTGPYSASSSSCSCSSSSSSSDSATTRGTDAQYTRGEAGDATGSHSRAHAHKNTRFAALTFLCILEPFNKGFHLLQEDALSFGHMGLVVPLQNRLFVQDVGLTKRQSRSKRTQSTPVMTVPQERHEREGT